jgi:CBS domain containing-hemolysin-like protein
MEALRHLPEAGETVVIGDYRFTVEAVTDKGIESIAVEPK